MLGAKRLAAKAIDAASTLTGKRFGLLVASSVVATSVVVASAVVDPPGGLSPLAALIGRSLAADSTPEVAPVEEGPTPEPRPVPAAGAAGPAPDQAFPSPSPGPAPAPAPAPAPERATPEETPAALPETGPVKHLFVVSLVSPGYEATWSETGSLMPYLNGELKPQGELLSGYSLLTENAVPNTLAVVSGQKPDDRTRADCPSFDRCVFDVQTTTVADQLTVGRYSWGAYMGGMESEGKPDGCVYPGAEEPYPDPQGGYTAKRNPFVFFHSLLDLGDCALADRPMTELEAALRKKADDVPEVTWVVPTLCDSGATRECPEGMAGGPAAADAFLSEWVPKILASPAYKADGMLVISFDQVDPVAVEGAVATDGADPLKVGALLVSGFLAPGSTDPKPYDPYSMLRSTEELYGLGYLGEARAKKTKSFATPLFGSTAGD